MPGYALDPDAIKSYIKIGQLQETKKKWPAGIYRGGDKGMGGHLGTPTFGHPYIPAFVSP